ncbi:hypothetical protein M3205_24280 [Cytobacillus firmus]|nr:hypothetical protein [Cytobacillus firmus]
MEVDEESERNEWIDNAQVIIENEEVVINSSDSDLDYQEAKVVKYTDNDLYSVTIPVKSSDHYEISNVAIHFDTNGKVETYSELLIQKSDIGTFQTILYINGEEEFNEVTNEAFYTYDEYKESLKDGITPLGLNFGGFIRCLGLPSVVGWQLGNICAVACMTGVLCVPCLAGALGMSTGAIATCFGLNWK